MSTDTTRPRSAVSPRSRLTAPAFGPWPFAQVLREIWPEATEYGDGTPGAELRETDDSFIAQVDLPGVGKDAVTIDVTGRRLQIHGERREPERDGVLRHSSRLTGSFAYEVTLPLAIDEAASRADLTDGVLTVTMPKAPAAKTTHLTIN